MSKVIIKKIGVTKLDVDAIVNAANSGLQAGGGVCGKIFEEAGHYELQKACNRIGYCKTGSAVITPGFNLKQRFIIHAVGPVWQGGNDDERKKLYGAYRRSLELAKENDLHSIGFPLISAGIFGYPKDQAWKVALQAAFDFIKKNRGSYDLTIYFAVLNDEILAMGKKELALQQEDYDDWCNVQDGMPRIDQPPLPIETGETEYHYIIFTGDGLHEYDKCKFVAEFPSQKMAANYVKYMAGKDRYKGKGIFIAKRECKRKVLSEDELDGIISAIGEVLMDNGEWLDQ